VSRPSGVRSILRKDSGDLGRVTGARQCAGQQDPGFLRGQVVCTDEARTFRLIEQEHPAAADATGLHHDHALLHSGFQGLELLGSVVSRRE